MKTIFLIAFALLDMALGVDLWLSRSPAALLPGPSAFNRVSLPVSAPLPVRTPTLGLLEVRTPDPLTFLTQVAGQRGLYLAVERGNRWVVTARGTRWSVGPSGVFTARVLHPGAASGPAVRVGLTFLRGWGLAHNLDPVPAVHPERHGERLVFRRRYQRVRLQGASVTITLNTRGAVTGAHGVDDRIEGERGRLLPVIPASEAVLAWIQGQPTVDRPAIRAVHLMFLRPRSREAIRWEEPPVWELTFQDRPRVFINAQTGEVEGGSARP